MSDHCKAWKCSCCGVMHRAQGVCCICAATCHVNAPHQHGDELQQRTEHSVRLGRLEPYHGMALMMLDDALLAGRLQLVPCPEGGVMPHIPVPVPRWLVVFGRALALGQQPDPQAVLQASVTRYLDVEATPENREALRRDLATAAMALGMPEERAATIRCSFDEVTGMATMRVGDGESMQLAIHRRPALGFTVTIPADIMSRPRGQA